MAYLTNDQIDRMQIDRMAHAAFTSYEFACSWKEAGRAAREYAVDEFGIAPRDSAVGLAVRIAQTRWQAGVMSVKRELAQ